MRDPVDGMRRGKKAGGAQIDSFDQIVAEMVVEPGPPSGAQRIPRLQHGAQPRATAAAYQTEMAAAPVRHQFENDARLAVALDAEHDAFVDPFHGGYVCTLAVIPGRGRAADPESIVTDCGYGFRVRRCAAPRNDDSDGSYSRGNSR